jgi:hypothetical protein
MLTLIAVTSISLFMPSDLDRAVNVHREPYLAVLTGLKCMNCHVNRTGGGARNLFGTVFQQTQLPVRTEGFEFRNRAITEWLNIGSDVRVTSAAYVTDATPRTSVEMERANVMLEARLLRSLALYIDETIGPGRAAARELFGIVENLPLNGYAKFGKFLLPYGLRLVDDQEFIRDRTEFSFLTPDQGVEVGFEPGPLSVFVALTNGSNGATEGDDDKQVTGSAAVITRRFRLGASASRKGFGGGTRKVYGGFAGFNAGRLAILGEVDGISQPGPTGLTQRQLVAYGEGNFQIQQGIHAKVTYGYHDRNTDVPEDQRIRVRLGLEVFPIPFLQASAFYTILDDIPQASGQQDRVALELHFFF